MNALSWSAYGILVAKDPMVSSNYNLFCFYNLNKSVISCLNASYCDEDIWTQSSRARSGINSDASFRGLWNAQIFDTKCQQVYVLSFDVSINLVPVNIIYNT